MNELKRQLVLQRDRDADRRVNQLENEKKQGDQPTEVFNATSTM